MIINIRGTSGTGKSTIVRSIMDCYDKKHAITEKGRKRPLLYMLTRADDDPNDTPLAVIGHYETACGGCDTISDGYDKIYETVRKAHNSGADVLYEGLLVSAEVERAAALHADGLPLLVLGLDVSLDLCLRSIAQRRRAKYDERCAKIVNENIARNAKGRKTLPLPAEPKPLNPKNTAAKHKGVVRCMERLVAAGVNAQFGSRDEVYKRIRKELEL